jgi:glycosyltransferase involved in cell wall biosynthesis
MFRNKKIGVIVPAYNEEDFIGTVIDTIPSFVDRIYVINDASNDKTLEIVTNKAKQNPRVAIINREIKGGVGAAILSGHKAALREEMDINVIMAGDGQMDPGILDKIINPIVDDKADYVKGDRLSKHEHKQQMPTWRFFGNLLLTNLTRIVSGYWHISDPQNGYTAIRAETLKKLDLKRIEKGFAFENDMLVKLNVVDARVMDIQHPAVYRGQHSKISYSGFICKTSWVLLKDFFWRVWVKYFERKVPRGKRTETPEWVNRSE